MTVNFIAGLPLNFKQKEQLAVKIILAERPDYFSLPLAERQNLRAQAINKLMDSLKVNKEEPQHVTTGLTISPAVNLQPSEAFTAATAKTDSLAPVSAKSIADLPTTIAEAKQLLDKQKIKHEAFALSIKLNDKQQLAADFAEAGKSFVLTGAAGTGKTTACREIARRLLEKGILGEHNFKVRGGGGYVFRPSITFVAYTNRAANNMRNALHKDPELEQTLDVNITTVHSLLEYEPEFFTREDGTTGMRFIPKRTASNPLRITHSVVEESSMLGIDLSDKLLEALPSGSQIIYVGDINQLPPIFSKSILNYALVTLPIVELTEVYRQALDNPIIANAHRCLKGEKLVEEQPYFRIISGKNINKIPSEGTCVQALVNSLQKWHELPMTDGTTTYDPEQDIVLCPYGKENKDRGSQANSTVINNYIAQFLGAKRNALVYEIIASMRKLYLAVGDRVMVDKQDGIITAIRHNARYVGQMPKLASTELTRFGVRLLGSSKNHKDEDFELLMEGYENLDVSTIPNETDEKKKLESSHVVEVKLDNGNVEVLHQTGDFSDTSFSLGYALTVHKAQGCEWRKVFLLLHRNHSQMLTRELIYTAITRAREYILIVDLCNQLDKGIANQRIKGNSIQEKIEWFNSEVSLNEPVQVCP